MNERLQIVAESLALALHARDPETAAHAGRVQEYALEIGRRMNLSTAELSNLKFGALLHDVGKLRTPDSVLHKTGALTDDEWLTMRRHPLEGADILRALRFPIDIVLIVEEHHENWDGSGYPHRRDAFDISLGARIVAVADAFDAMTARRSYQEPKSDAEAFAELLRCRDRQFDALVVADFVNLRTRPRLCKPPNRHPRSHDQTTTQRLTQNMGAEAKAN